MKKQLILISACVSLLVVSCENELPIDLAQPDNAESTIEHEDPFIPYEGEIRLGKQLENPYSVANMRKAMELLPTESRGGYTIDDIQPTHLYVKFKPANVDELDALFWSNSDIHFYSYPLDYERQPGGSYYRDPSLPEDVPTYYYASVPINRPLPKECDYVVLEELYIPDETTEYTRSLLPTFVNAIVAKSFEITNNDLTCSAIATRSDGQTRANPTYSGTIKAWDDKMNTHIPIPGALIKCTRWFTTVTAITNINGEYTMTRESNNPYTYAIYWERDHKYDIREGSLNQAVTGGPKQEFGWSVSMDRESSYSRGVNYATITRVAHRYFYGETGGLDRAIPMATGDLKICYMHNESHPEGWSGYFNSDISFEVSGDIFIYSKQSDGSIFETQDIFSTTAHEIGHSTQCATMTRNEFLDVDDLLIESWGEFVEGLLTYIEYGYIGLYNPDIVSFEYYCNSSIYGFGIKNAIKWPTINHDNYTGLFIDLYDNSNQRSNYGQTTLPNDNITGYSPSFLNAMINQCYDLEDIRVYLKTSLPPTITSTMIDNFINFYIENKPNENN